MESSTYTLQQGTEVFFDNTSFIVLQIVNLEYVLAEHVNTGDIRKLRISELLLTKPLEEVGNHSAIDAIPDKDWQIAQQRLEIIRPLVKMQGRTKADVEKVADVHGVHINSIYKWLKLYKNSGLLSSLVNTPRSDIGVKKLSAEIEAIVSSCIDEEYLSKQKKSVANLYKIIKLQCHQANLKAPHVNTIRKRINEISNNLKIAKRYGSNKVHELTHINKGEFPHADYPLSVIQIDHTPLDIILVDEEYRLPVQRPWVTMAIDVFSRMVVGFYVSFDPPSAVSVGVCLANSILPKEQWLAEHNVDCSWPCWGIPRTVHADNAKEFRGKMLQLACDQYGMTLEWRPVARPHFGAHIERLLGTFAKEIHALPGTTFSNIQQKDSYDSEKHSAFTLKEFEEWLALLVTQSYHHNFHSGINCSPLSKYESGILGTKTTKGIGLPSRIKDEETLRLNFLPVVERTIQDYGIRIDNVYYYHDVLRVWINSTVEGNSKHKRQFTFRRDPRDISVVWFFDPQLKTYYPIPYRNLTLPSVSTWEFNAALKKLKDEGLSNIDETVIFDAIEKMRVIEKNAVQDTKKARRAHEKRKVAKRKSIKATPEKKVVESTVIKTLATEEEDDDVLILPFDEMLEVNSYE